MTTTATTTDMNDYPIYYYCPTCDWRGSDSPDDEHQPLIRMSGIICPECCCNVSTDRVIMDGMDDACGEVR